MSMPANTNKQSLIEKTYEYNYIENNLDFQGVRTVATERINCVKHFKFFTEYNIWLFTDYKCYEFNNPDIKVRKNNSYYGQNEQGMYTKFREFIPGDVVKFQYSPTHHTYYRVLPKHVAFYDISTTEDIDIEEIVAKQFKLLMEFSHTDPKKHFTKTDKVKYPELYDSCLNFIKANTRVGYIKLPLVLWNEIPRKIHKIKLGYNYLLSKDKFYLTDSNNASLSNLPYAIPKELHNLIAKTNTIDFTFNSFITFYKTTNYNPDIFNIMFHSSVQVVGVECMVIERKLVKLGILKEN
jgi:signal peptidase I